MSVKNRIVIYSATGVDIIFGWNIKRISNGDYRLGDIVYPNQNKSRAYILRLQYPLSKHIHHVFPAIQGYLVPLCEVLCTSQVYHLYNQ